MIPDGVQYFLDDFGNFEHFVKIWSRILPNYYQNASTIQDKSGNILEKYDLCKYGNHQMEHITFCWISNALFCIWVLHLYIISGEGEDRKMMKIG